jgi:hypothetical protein
MNGQDASQATHRDFERYLNEREIVWKHLAVGSDKTADYRVGLANAEMTCEVKTLVGSRRLMKSGGYDPWRSIQRKIRRARPQLKTSCDEPCCVVLNSRSSLHHLDASLVACAAFGPGFTQHRPDRSVIDNSPPFLRFSRRHELPAGIQHLANPVLSSTCNRTVSGLVVFGGYALRHRDLEVWKQLMNRQRSGEKLRPGESQRVLETQRDRLPSTYQYQGTLRAIVLENPHARVSFPEDLFRGPFDQRWRAFGDLYGPQWIGSTLRELFAADVPFHML